MTDKEKKLLIDKVVELKEWQPIATPALDRLFSFIESLQEELENEDLKVEIKNFLDQTGAPFYWAGEEEQLEWVEIIAQHFAEWQEQKDKEQILILKDKIESCHAAMKCKDELMEIKLHEQKEEMTKDAINGYVDQVEYPDLTLIQLSENPKDLKDGDKVKLIIIKEE